MWVQAWRTRWPASVVLMRERTARGVYCGVKWKSDVPILASISADEKCFVPAIRGVVGETGWCKQPLEATEHGTSLVPESIRPCWRVGVALATAGPTTAEAGDSLGLVITFLCRGRIRTGGRLVGWGRVQAGGAISGLRDKEMTGLTRKA